MLRPKIHGLGWCTHTEDAPHLRYADDNGKHTTNVETLRDLRLRAHEDAKAMRNTLYQSEEGRFDLTAGEPEV